MTRRLSNVDLADSVLGSNITGFAIGSQFAYFGEPAMGTVCSQDHATACVPDPTQGNADGCPDVSPPGQACVILGDIEKAAIPSTDAGAQGANAIVIARGQSTPTSFAVDGTHVYWTTTNCDISFLADSPQ